MDLNFDMNFSKIDIQREIRIPTKLDEELSELIGIIIGDGHIKNDKNYRNYQIYVTGNLKDDITYFNRRVSYLFYKIFNLKFKIIRYERNNYFNAVVNSKLIVNFFNNSIGIPAGKKSHNLRIPVIILNSNLENQIAFIRGISDTDLGLGFKNKDKKSHKYPIIKGKFRSPYIVNQLSFILNKLKIGNCIYNSDYYDKRFERIIEGRTIQISGKVNLERWMLIIGFKNSRHYTKYQIWKKFGFCPPYTTLEQRNQILSGKLDPRSFYDK